MAAVTGSVNLTARGKQVEVKPGTVSKVAGGELEDASPALLRVLLSVRWPQQRATSKDTVPVSGKVEAGSRVFIQGQPIPVEPGGSFRAAHVVGYFDTIGEMHRVYDRYRGHTGLAADATGWRLLK